MVPSEVTAAPTSAVTQVQSAISSVATSVISDINSLLPVNCSIGMKDFCINFSCHELPINFSKLLPGVVTAPIQAQLSYILDISRAASPLTLRNCLFAGIAFIFLFAILVMLDICIPHPNTLLLDNSSLRTLYWLMSLIYYTNWHFTVRVVKTSLW